MYRNETQNMLLWQELSLEQVVSDFTKLGAQTRSSSYVQVQRERQTGESGSALASPGIFPPGSRSPLRSLHGVDPTHRHIPQTSGGLGSSVPLPK